MNALVWFESEYFRRRLSNSQMQETLLLATETCFETHERAFVQQHPLWQAAQALMVYLDTTAANTQVTYHNNHHFADTILAAALLGSAEPGLSLMLRLVLLSTMCAHDVHHDGTSNTETKNLEEISAMVFDGFMRNVSVPYELCEMVTRTIRSTDPKKSVLNRNGYIANVQNGGMDELALLAGLAHDADLLGSLLPKTGLHSSQSLSTEWTVSGQPHAKNVATFKGRAHFLLHAEPITRGARLLGINDNHAAQLEALRSFDAKSQDAVEGGAYLDTLVRTTAEALYLNTSSMALERLRAQSPQRYTGGTNGYPESELPFLP